MLQCESVTMIEKTNETKQKQNGCSEWSNKLSNIMDKETKNYFATHFKFIKHNEKWLEVFPSAKV